MTLRSARWWELFVVKHDGTEMVIHTRWCKVPSRLKEWTFSMQHMLNNNIVHKIGYRIKEN